MTRLEQLAAKHNRSPLEVLEMFLERAAIRQYDAGQTREQAEEGAYSDAVAWLEAS